MPHTTTPWVYEYGAVYADQDSGGPGTRILLADREEPKTSPTERDDNLRLSAHAVTSYDKHCGANAIQCAEDDLLGQALGALRDIHRYLGAGPIKTDSDRDFVQGSIESILSRLPHTHIDEGYDENGDPYPHGRDDETGLPH